MFATVMKKRRTALTVVKPAKKPEPERFEDVVARMALPDFDDLTDAQWVARAKKWLRKFAEL
ncbi:MAG: hypothetical protein J2P48_10990, partial [Alphaproteobacteria bacterium]|nr:hypothetical protein [Alphaproteobacteria bacterium]